MTDFEWITFVTMGCILMYLQKVEEIYKFQENPHTFEGIRNYSSLMIGDKVFAGVETNDWKSVSGIVAQETKLNNNFSIISGVRFKEKIRGYFLSLNWNETPCLCREQKPYKVFIGLKSLTLKDIRPLLGIRYKLL